MNKAAKKKYKKRNQDPNKVLQRAVDKIHFELEILEKVDELNGVQSRALVDYTKALVAVVREQRQESNDFNAEDLSDEELEKVLEETK